jgi:hypothetical protein
MPWTQRLKRVFGIDIKACPGCGAAVRIIACIEGPVVVEEMSPTWMRKLRNPKPRGGWPGNRREEESAAVRPSF